MPTEDNLINFDFFIFMEDGSECSEEAIDRVMEKFLDACVEEGMCAGGGVGPPPPEERTCQRCEGIGIADPIPEERKCPTCDGSGEVDPDAMTKEEWEELYGTKLP